MDFSQFDATDASNTGHKVHLKHPVTRLPLYHEDDPDKPVTITILGENSAKYKEINNEIARRSGVRFIAARGNEEKAVNPELSKKETLMRTVRTTIEWSYVGDEKGEIQFSEKNAQAFYERFDWALDQVLQEQEDISNFLPPSDEGSQSGQKPASSSTAATKKA
jgi:hypothetical protein